MAAIRSAGSPKRFRTNSASNLTTGIKVIPVNTAPVSYTHLDVYKRQAQGEDTVTYDQAAGIFETMSLSADYPEFLTLPLSLIHI